MPMPAFRITDIGKGARHAGRCPHPHGRGDRSVWQPAVSGRTFPAQPSRCRPIRFLARDEVRHVATAVAFVVAATVDAGGAMPLKPSRSNGSRNHPSSGVAAAMDGWRRAGLAGIPQQPYV